MVVIGNTIALPCMMVDASFIMLPKDGRLPTISIPVLNTAAASIAYADQTLPKGAGLQQRHDLDKQSSWHRLM